MKINTFDFRYRKNVHARVEKRGPNETIYHSLEVNGPINVELKRHNLETMDAVFKVRTLVGVGRLFWTFRKKLKAKITQADKNSSEIFQKSKFLPNKKVETLSKR